jgi:hypothetical protein
MIFPQNIPEEPVLGNREPARLGEKFNLDLTVWNGVLLCRRLQRTAPLNDESLLWTSLGQVTSADNCFMGRGFLIRGVKCA